MNACAARSKLLGKYFASAPTTSTTRSVGFQHSIFGECRVAHLHQNEPHVCFDTTIDNCNAIINETTRRKWITPDARFKFMNDSSCHALGLQNIIHADCAEKGRPRCLIAHSTIVWLRATVLRATSNESSQQKQTNKQLTKIMPSCEVYIRGNRVLLLQYFVQRRVRAVYLSGVGQ
jgi:hypothetical protein